MVRVTDWKRIAVEAEDPASLVGLRGICATTRHGLGTLFLSTQRSGAARNALQGRLPPGGDRSDAFLVVRNAANSTGLVPLGLKGHDASSTSTSSSSSSSSVPVAWFLNRRKRGAKTSTQVRASDSRDGSTAHVAVASDNKRRCEVYDVAELSSASPRPSVTLPAPFPSKGFRWKTLRVSAAGDAVCALCLDDRASSSEPSPSPSLWLWTRYSGQWNRVDVAQPVDDDGTNRVSLAFAEGRNKFVALSCRVSPAAASPLLLERTEVDLKPSLDLTGPRNLAGGSMGRTSRAEVDLPRGFAPASKVQALDARGSLFAVAVSCERDFAVLVLDEGLGTRGVGLPPPSLASDLLVVAVTVFDLPSASTVGVATLCRGGLFCVFDDRGRLLRVLQTQPCMTTGSTPPSLAPLHFGGQQYIACAANDGEVRVLGVQSGDPGTDEEDDDWEAEVEEDLEAEEEERRKGSKAAEEVYFDFLESLLTVSSYGKPFDTLLGDFEGVLTTLGSKLGPRLVLNSLHDMILTLCEEEEHLASLWLLEAAEGLGNREERDWSRGLTSLDWLNLWQILANSVFESLEQRGDGEGARDGGFYHEVASALWKRLASSGFDSLAKSQFDAANDGVFGGQGDLAGMILDADRAFVHGDLHKSLALYREAGAEASLSHIACCIHSDMAEECLEATYSLLCVGEEGGIMPPGLSQGELRSMKAEACSELGRLLIEAHRPSQNDAAGGVTFPSPLSWSTRGGHGHEGTTCRRLSLDWNKLRESLKKGRAASPSLALGLFLHSLQASKVSMLVDASLLWDYLGHWRRAVCLLKACGRVFKSYGKDKAAEHIGRETVLYLKSKLEGKLGDLDVLLDGNSLGEFDSIFRTFLLLPESATKSETFGVLMKKLQASVNKEIAKSLSVIDLRSLQGLGETCTRLYKLVGALCSVLVSISRPVYSLEDLSYGENGVLQVSGATNVGDECYESLSSAYEDMIQLSRTIRSYALLALQWQSWQSSASAKERKEFMKETVLCLALILSSDPGSAAQRSQKVQKMACWILKEFISAEVFQEDPALVSLVKNSIPMGCMTGPTRKALESISGEAGLDTENLEEEAEAYMDILQSDSAAYVHDLFGICSEAIAWTETNIDDKSFDDEGLSLIHLALLEGFASFPRGPRDNDSQDPKWPTLDMCIAHPLNCGANFNIDADERVLANILTLGPFATGSSSDTEEGDVFSEVSEIDVVESVIVDEEEEGLNVIRLVFRNVQGLETEDSGDSSSTVLNIRIDVGDDDVSLPPEESTTFTDSSCEEERLILNSIAENLVNDAITEAISQALVEGAIAHAISAAAQVQETAEPVLDQEDVKSSDVAEEEPDTSSAEIAAKALVEDAIAYAISAAAVMEEAQASEFEPVSVSVSEPEQEDTKSPVVDEEEPDTSSAEIAVKTLVEGAIAHAISAAELHEGQGTEPEPEPVSEPEQEDTKSPVVDEEEPDTSSAEIAAKALVEGAIAHAISAAELHEGQGTEPEPEPVSEPEQEDTKSPVVDEEEPDTSSAEIAAKALVEGAIAHAISAAELQDSEPVPDPEEDVVSSDPEGEDAAAPSSEPPSVEDIPKTPVEEAETAEPEPVLAPRQEDVKSSDVEREDTAAPSSEPSSVEGVPKTPVEDDASAAVMVLEEAETAEPEPVSVSEPVFDQEDAQPSDVDEEEPDTSSAEIAVKTLVEGAIAHAISAAAQVQETAEPVLDQEDVKSSDVAEEEPDTSSAEIAAKALVEDAIAYAISVAAVMEEAQASEFEPVSVSVSEPEQEDTKSPVVDEEEPDTSSAEIAVKTLVEGAIAHAISAAELQDSEPVPMLEQEEEKLSNVEGDAAAPSLEPPSVEGVSKTPVEDDASAAVTVLEEAGTAEPEPVLEPEQDYVEPSDVDGDAAAASSSKPPSGQEPIVKALVEDAIAHAVSAAVLQDAAEASLQLTSDVPAKSEHGTDSGDMEQKEARQDDAKLPPKSPERVSEKKEVDERASPPSKSSGVLLETTNKPASAGESISDDGVRDESDSMSESSPKQRNYQNLTEVRSSLEDIHIMTQEAKRNLEKEESARDVAKQNAQRPWETDLALFKGLSKSGAEHRHDEADDEVVKKPATRREARRKKTRKAKAPQAGSKREVVERKIATTQTESKSPQRVDPQERASEEKSPKEVILLELKRIKKEYLSAIKQAQRALKTQDPSINKVLASQVETLKDYDEILEMATGSVPEQSEDKSYPEPELRKPAEPEIPSATLATKKGVMESDEESPSSQSPSSDSPSSSDEQEEERRRRRKRAAEMLRKIVSNSRSRRKSKETLEANQKIVEDASTSEGPVVTDYRKDMPLKEQTDNLLDQMGKAVELSSQTTLHQGDGREDSHTEDADDNQTAVAPSQEELEAPKLAQQGHGGEEGKGEEDESTDVARELDIETQEARPLLGIPLERDPAFDLFAHFFELKSTDPTRHLREKFKSSPHTRYGSIKRNNFKSFLFQLSEFCGSGFSKNELLYIELLFDAVISVTGRTTSRMSEPPSWEIVEERFVQISWHYYQGIRRKEMNLEFMLASTKEHVSECSEDVEGSLANDLGLSEVSEIPLSQLPAVLAAFFSKISMDLSVRDVCLVFWDCMHSRLARSETFDLTTLMDLMQPESMRRKEVPRLEVTKSPTSDENLPILEPEPAAEPPREEKEEETQPAAEPPREEKEEETQPAVEPPREEKEEETQPAAEPPREEKEEETQPAVEPPREEEEEPEPAAEPPQEEKEGETRGEVVRELGVSSLEVSDEEETTHIEDEGPQAIKGSLSEAQDQTQAPPPANDVEESLGVIEPAREDRLPGIPAYVSDAVETCLQEAKAVDFVESEPVSALPEVLERKEEGGAARSESEESMPERGPAISSGSSMDKINLNEILLDIKGGEENWLKVSKAPPSSGASYGSHAFADFFDVQSISMSDFQQSSPREVLHLQALDPEPGRRKTTMARKNMLVPASNVELEELFAEMDEMERKEESLPKRKTKAEKKLEKETRSALSKLKTKQNARRERVKQELKAERKRYAEAEKRAKENVLKYAKLRQQNYESILADVQTALVEAEVAAYTLETENEELHDFLEEMSSEQNESHTKYISKLQDHLSLVEAQIGAAAE